MPASYLNNSVDDLSMQASKNYSDGTQQSYSYHHPMPMKEMQFHSPHSFQSENACSDDGSQLSNLPPHYCTLESSVTPRHAIQSSPSTLSLNSTTGSPTLQQDCQSDNYGSPADGSCLTEDPSYLKQKLKELEIAMLGPESDIVDSFHSTLQSHLSLEPEKWNMLMAIPRGDLKQMLLACATSVADNDMAVVDWLMGELQQMVSVSGDPVQRLGAYLYEGLKAKLGSSGSSIYKALKCKEPLSSDLQSYMHFLFEFCPYFKFGYISANGAIAEAVKGENMVHIIDFQIGMGTQWVTLIQALAARPGGPPHIRITGVDDPFSEHARGGGLHIVGDSLAQLAASCGVPFDFHAVVVSGYEVKAEHLYIRPGEVLAVNFAYQLHHVPDESVTTWNHRDRLIRMVKSLSPKVVTLVEQEANTNTAPFVSRFMETMDYYTAVFESIDATPFPRENKKRISVEQHCVARDIVNIIACEGIERVERHELLGKWKSRFMMAGFEQVPLSSMVNTTIKSLLQKYNMNFRLMEQDGALYLGWKNRALVVSCAWR